MFSQQTSYKLININLVGVNVEPKVENLTRLQRYFEPGGVRLNIYAKEKITLDSLRIPRITDSNEPNFLMLSLIENYLNKKKIQSPSTLTIFCLPFQNSKIHFQSYNSFGFSFYNQSATNDSYILACAAGSMGISHLPDTSQFIKDSSVIYSLKLASVNYFSDFSRFKRTEETGLTAYYTWEEDANGVIIYDPKNPLLHIKRIKKENFSIKYLDPGNWFFKPFVILMDTKICPAHITVVAVTLICLMLFFRWIKQLSKEKKWQVKFGAWILRVLFFIFSLLSIGFNFYLIDQYYTNNYVTETQIQELEKDDNFAILQAKIQDKLLFENDTVPNLNSQIFRKKKDEWYIQRNAPVLIFQLNHQNELKFKEGSDALTYRNDTLLRSVQNHYIKIERINDNDEVISEQIYNFKGEEVYSTSFSTKKNGKRIVLFVNGYRSPFLSSDEFSRSVMLKRILENKTEIEKTSNKIFSFDIHEYWNPWDRFDERFISKLQPHEVYYADGHHSIRTSNYNMTNIPLYTSLLNNLGDLSYFYFAASNYPTVCSNLSQHSCKYVSLPKIGVKKTWELLPSKSNYAGFNERRESGTIAGKNLLQLFNGDNLNMHSRDTVYIVCHSMGFAYAQGIIESLRGKINFGGYYIFSPENPSAGRINPSEWQEVWQFGSNERLEECLQDGIAPQSSIEGLEKHRVYFPKSIYSNLGYTGSHFIGNFTWVFDLNKSQGGFITPR